MEGMPRATAADPHQIARIRVQVALELDDGVEAERDGHPPGLLDHLGPARFGVVAGVRGTEPLVAVAGVDVHEEVRALDDFLGEGMGDAFAEGAVRLPREQPVQVLAVVRAEVDRPAQERRQVGHVDQDHRAADLRRVQERPQALHGEDGRVLGAVNARHQGEHGARTGPVHDGEGQEGSRVTAGRGATSRRPDTVCPGSAAMSPSRNASCPGAGAPGSRSASVTDHAARVPARCFIAVRRRIRAPGTCGAGPGSSPRVRSCQPP